MGFALCFGSQTPNPFYPFCHRRNKGTHGMGASKEGLASVFGFSSFRFLSFASRWKSAKGLQEEIPGVYVSDTGRGKASAGSFDVFAAGTSKSSSLLTQIFELLL
ncbi:hypothetical protein Pyn_12544 [Prunus yedoensis var. nudiflora]|uniref:Uncharacterized protein n=1 Tax=Prunus yedoensis var. nudiflora TaxID=2094558 RepID=A0A314Y621_PRUYE|nr:hypothetical protein Pyn_12544 [Prunus yedoensis var. nudiflora]